MKRIVLAIFSAALLFAACSKDDEEQAAATQQESVDAGGHLVFYSTTGRASKVAMANRLQQCFTADDQVAIFESPSKKSIYEVDVEVSTKVSGSSTLYSTAKLVYLSGDELTEGSEHYAVMPSSATWSGGSISVYQAQEQLAPVGSQYAEGCIHYAKTSSSAIAFNTLSAMFRLNVIGTNSDCDEIRLTATGIAGDATITISTGAISAGSDDEVLCKAADELAFHADTTYYYGFLPGTYTTLTATAYSDGTAIDGATVTYSGKTWNSGTVYNLYLKGGKLYKKKPTTEETVEGSLPEGFSVSATLRVKFAKGNLQYTTTGTHTVAGGGTAPGTWRFAEHQYDYVGSGNSSISDSYSGWIDLFGFGTSGWNSGAECYQPYSASPFGTGDYPYIGGDASIALTGDNANGDWGVYNAISNGGNTPGMWRTLTRSEWLYLCGSRTDCENKFALATVDGMPSMIILPDNWTAPDGLTLDCTCEGSVYYFSTNTYTAEEWAKMEAAGAVLIPAGGRRNGTSVENAGARGYLWTSTGYGSGRGYLVQFYDGQITFSLLNRAYGFSVRLVHDMP